MQRKPSPRLTNFDHVGCHRYFLTICTDNRARVFVTDDAVALVLMDLSRTADDRQFSVIAYCFMPDHVHALAEGVRASSDFREFVRIFKQRSAFRWRQRHCTALWQRSYFEHVLRNDEDTVAVARYILNNPIRAGIVECAEDYAFLGSGTTRVTDLLYSVQF